MRTRSLSPTACSPIAVSSGHKMPCWGVQQQALKCRHSMRSMPSPKPPPELFVAAKGLSLSNSHAQMSTTYTGTSVLGATCQMLLSHLGSKQDLRLLMSRMSSGSACQGHPYQISVCI